MKKKTQIFDPRQTMIERGYEVFHYLEPKGADVDVHHHDFYEVYCLLSGQADYWVDGETYHLRTGDLLLINPMELHRPIVKCATTYERYVLWIEKGYLDALDGEGILARCFTESTLISGGNAVELLGRLVDEAHSYDYGAKICADGIFLQLMVELNRLSLGAKEGKPQSALVSQVLEYIGEHYHEALSLDLLAAEFFVSKYHLSHAFKCGTGTSVYQYIKMKRLAAARQLLLMGVSSSDTCARCGFLDYSAFYKAFKEQYGVAPSDLQR